jgi:hypothetical protein
MVSKSINVWSAILLISSSTAIASKPVLINISPQLQMELVFLVVIRALTARIQLRTVYLARKDIIYITHNVSQNVLKSIMLILILPINRVCLVIRYVFNVLNLQFVQFVLMDIIWLLQVLVWLIAVNCQPITLL